MISKTSPSLRKLILVTLSLSLSILVFGQHNIQSTVFDQKDGTPLEFATVRLLNAKDSVFVKATNTGTTGTFTFTKIQPGNYILTISLLGYEEYKSSIVMADKALLLKNIQMNQKSTLLKEVEVKGIVTQMTVKKDTLEYNATAFKTEKNAIVEDLLKRLPGVEVAADGKITVNGQDIKKIRVDGKKFFDGDIEMATKNIPADMVDKIQVYDQKSDMAQLTGFEDDNTERIINITTKANRKRGVFGNVTAGGGVDLDKDFRYDGNFFLNFMNNDIQTSLVGGLNNTNNTRSTRGRNGMGNPGGGISETQNLGVNNNTIINKSLKIGGDASLNHSSNTSITSNDRQNYLKDKVNSNSNDNRSYNENYSANMRAEIEWKPDTLNTFIFQPSVNYNRSFSNGNSNFIYLTGKDTTSVGKSENHGNRSSIGANFNFIYSHKFSNKKGRTLTANVSSGINDSDNKNWNYSERTINKKDTIIDFYNDNTSNNFNASLRASYVEPLWNLKNFLETSVSFSANKNSSNKDQYNKDNQGNYTIRDIIYSNDFSNEFYSEEMELNYRYVSANYNIMLGFRGNPSQISYLRHYLDGTQRDTTYGVLNFSPTASLKYNFSKKIFLRLEYRGQTNQPNINQMQPVKNNSNQMNEVIGNPNLNPEFNNNLRLFFSSYNDSTYASINAGLFGNFTKDALTTNSIYDITGKQYSQTVNSYKAPFNMFGNFMFNIPLIKKRLHFNTNTSGSFSRRYGYSKIMNILIDDNQTLPLGDLSSTRSYSASEGLSLTFTNDAIEIGARGNVRYSNTYNSLSTLTTQTWDWTAGGNVVFHLPYDINMSNDLTFTTLQGYSSFDKKQLIWNASIDKSLLEKRGVIALKLFDILHQRLNINQFVGDNYLQTNKFNTLTSYFLLSFSYKINQFRRAEGSNDDRFGPPDGQRRDNPERRTEGRPQGRPEGGRFNGGGGFGGPSPF